MIKVRRILLFVALGMALLFTACQSQQTTKVYDFTAVTNEGSELSFANYKGKVLLIVPVNYPVRETCCHKQVSR